MDRAPLPPSPDDVIDKLRDLVSPATAANVDDVSAMHIRATALIEREIEKCRQFASIYQDIPLYSLEDFMRLAPPEAHTDDEHQLMLNRLAFELAERQRLDTRKKELMQQKEDLLKESKAQVSTMDNVKSQIEALVKTASEIQKKVDELVKPLPEDTNTPA
ncbi:hypothetical protein ONZ45_g8493 [Pleurotus djamor]|nr:hypothetical protein ONZ45_g8493 [Pleurotus djamor]